MVDIARKLDKLLETNTPIIITHEEEKKHIECEICKLYAVKFTGENYKVIRITAISLDHFDRPFATIAI